MSRQKKYTFIDLFAGCGGLSLGLEQAGFEVVFMNEIVETFASTYLANHSLKQGQYFIGDINELNTCLDKYRDTLKNPDRPITLVCGGPPCQGFSMANRQRIIDDPRNQLYKAYLQFLSEIRPQFFIMETTASDGKNYNTTYYNLDAIISVGYRVNSVRATQFRQWCTFILRQFAIRGYVLDHKRMENGAFLGVDYFEHLLAEIREIRLSERRFYQKLTDIYATAIDYNKDAPTTRLFFKKVQNKMHYAVHGHTAAELIVERANANKEQMGLTTWENAPNGKIVKTDVFVAKNYLREKELDEMGRMVNAFLDMAESMAKRHIPMTMEDWAKRIDKFINLFDSPILQDSGKVSAEYAKEFAESEFEKYRIIQDRLFQSDFDRFEDNSLPSLDME